MITNTPTIRTSTSSTADAAPCGYWMPRIWVLDERADGRDGALADHGTVPYSPIVSTKMKIEPITMPGHRLRQDHLPEGLHQLPPRSRAASIACRSTCASRKKSGVIMNRM